MQGKSSNGVVSLSTTALELLKSQLFYLSQEAIDILLRVAGEGRYTAELKFVRHVLGAERDSLEKLLAGDGDEEDALFALQVLLWNFRRGRMKLARMPEIPSETSAYVWEPMRWIALCGFREVVSTTVGESLEESYVVLAEAQRLLSRRSLLGELPREERFGCLPDLLNVVLPTGALASRMEEVLDFYYALRQSAIDRPLDIEINGWSFGLLAYDLGDRSTTAFDAMVAIEMHELNRGSLLDFPAFWAAAALFGDTSLGRLLTSFPRDAADLLAECLRLSATETFPIAGPSAEEVPPDFR